MAKLDKNKTGLALGAFFAVFHAIWAIFIAITAGGVQRFIDWILGLHMIQMQWTIMPFNIVSAVLLVVVTFVFGYIFGWIFAAVWNYVVKK
ncbi:hypothetical protein KY319_04965 [Candidatus Woesearchaeota archaeon]|nr:hypothetical protein [Candidatus Woesearchaeota archaeon]